MSTIESCIFKSPSKIEEECAKFTIDDTSTPFILHEVASIGQKYTLSFWVQADGMYSMNICGHRFTVSDGWTRHTIEYTATSRNLGFIFNNPGVYYMYHPQLEIGNKASDWVKAPEDTDQNIQNAQETADSASDAAQENAIKLSEAEALIEVLQRQIAMLVTDSTGASLMTQTADGGWTFSMAQTQQTIDSIQNTLSELDAFLNNLDTSIVDVNKAIETVKSDTEWVKMTTYEDEPCIALGETGSDFKLLITNTRIMFLDGTDVPAYISNKALNITKAVIKEELQQGPFVWKIRANGNMGLLWKGVSS